MRKKGFTLVELMVAIALGSIVMVGATVSIVGMVRQGLNAQTWTQEQGEASNIRARISSSVRRGSSSSSLTAPNSQELIVDLYNDLGVATFERFHLESISGSTLRSLIWTHDVDGVPVESEICDSILSFDVQRMTTGNFRSAGVLVVFDILSEATGRRRTNSATFFAAVRSAAVSEKDAIAAARD